MMDGLTGTYRGPRGDVFELRATDAGLRIVWRSLTPGKGFRSRIVAPDFAAGMIEHSHRVTDLRNRTVALWG